MSALGPAALPPALALPHDAAATAVQPQLPTLTAGALAALAVSNFAVGSAAMSITGLLPDVGRDLQTSAAAAAQLLTGYALAFAISAPVVAVLAARVCRKKLLMTSLAAYGVLTLLLAAMPSLSLALACRCAAGVAAAAFVPSASAVVGALAAPAQRGRALAVVFGGFTAALVLGAPLGTYAGHAVGWRLVLVLLGGAVLAAALWLRRALPSGIVLPGATLLQLRQVLSQPRLTLLIGLNTAAMFGSFLLFSFAAVALAPLLQGPPAIVALGLTVFGLGNLLGNGISVLWLDRVGAAAMASIAAALSALALGVLALRLPSAVAWVALALWGLGTFVFTAAQQTRLVAAAPLLSAALLPLNSSAMFAGQSLAAVAGDFWLLQARDPASAAAGLALGGSAALVLVALVSVWMQRR